jgi:hypothetical protein
VVIGPGYFETVRKQFDGLVTIGIPNQEAGCCSAESTHHPKNISHCGDSLFVSDSDFDSLCFDAACGLDAASF